MKKLVEPRGLVINFTPSERQYELWNALQPNRCDKCGGELEMRKCGTDKEGHVLYEPVCKNCGNNDIPEQILSGGSAGGGKMGLLDSQVLTPFGYRKLADIKVGDIITSPTTGGMQRVVYLHPVGEFDFYRVKFRDDTYFDCSEGHLWQLHESRKAKSKKAKKYNLPVDTVWPTIKMYEWYQKKKAGMYEGMHLIIPLTEPVKFTSGDKGKYYVDPYIIGALIGDGCMTNSVLNKGYVEFINTDLEIEKRFEALGYDMSHKYSKKVKEVVWYYHLYDEKLLKCLEKCGIAGNKSQTHFLPKAYKLGTIEERIKLMQGLMDTDGYVDDRGHMSYSTTSKQLAEDVAFVVRSLGGVARITSDIGSYKNEDGVKIECSEVWTVYFRTKMDPDLCGISRKKARAKYEFNGGNSEYGKRIVDVEYLGKRKGRCISVSEPNGLYVVDDFTVTHNSYLGSAWLVSSCIRFPKISMIVARKELKVLRATTWKTIKNIMDEWKLEEDVNYHINNADGVITFWNGSTISQLDLAPQPSDPDYNNLGSLEITGAFIDEVAEISEKAVEVLASRIRYRIAETFVVGKILMSCNPTLNWPRRTFVQDDDGFPVRLPRGYRFIRFSLFDNPDEKFRAIYFNKLSKIRDKATRLRLLYGNWDFVEGNTMAAYWSFDGESHLVQSLKEKAYDPLRPLVLSFDFNVAPYMSCLPMQFDFTNKKIYVFPEFVGKPKDLKLNTPAYNNTPAFTKYIRKALLSKEWNHQGGVLVTGDPAGLARSTQTEDGVNNFTIALNNLASPILRPSLKLLPRQPAMKTRLEFINELFEGFGGWQILIDIRCRRLTDDLVYQKKNADGTKDKKKVSDDNGNKVERYGHLSDCFDYSIVYFLGEDYARYRSGAVETVTTVEPGTVVYGDFDY